MKKSNLSIEQITRLNQLRRFIAGSTEAVEPLRKSSNKTQIAADVILTGQAMKEAREILGGNYPSWFRDKFPNLAGIEKWYVACANNPARLFPNNY